MILLLFFDINYHRILLISRMEIFKFLNKTLQNLIFRLLVLGSQTMPRNWKDGRRWKRRGRNYWRSSRKKTKYAWRNTTKLRRNGPTYLP